MVLKKKKIAMEALIEAIEELIELADCDNRRI